MFLGFLFLLFITFLNIPKNQIQTYMKYVCSSLFFLCISFQIMLWWAKKKLYGTGLECFLERSSFSIISLFYFFNSSTARLCKYLLKFFLLFLKYSNYFQNFDFGNIRPQREPSYQCLATVPSINTAFNTCLRTLLYCYVFSSPSLISV